VVARASTARPRQARQSAAQRKAAIVEATLDLVAEHGAEGVTVRQIAERAGVQHPLIYRHFGDKRTLVVLALRTEMDAWAAVVAQHDEPAAAVVAGFRHLVAHPKAAAAFRLTLARQLEGAHDQEVFPIADSHAAVLVAAGVPPRRALDVSIGLMALVAGWVAAEPFWLAAGRRRGEAEAARRSVEGQLRALVEAALAV
jgi:AcrR family transcriptional regulator